MNMKSPNRETSARHILSRRSGFWDRASITYSISCGRSPGDHPIGRVDLRPVEVVLPFQHVALRSKGDFVITGSTSGDLRDEGYDCERLKTEIFVMRKWTNFLFAQWPY